MILINILTTSTSSSFSECFSAKSYLSGNSISYELTLNLLPFERLNLITEQNLCQMYLPGKTVVVQLHFDDISFPTAGQEISFVYKFNESIKVSFKLSPTDYSHIYSKQNAMYELWYDVNLRRTCVVPLNSDSEVFIEYQVNGSVEQIPFQPCTNDCDPDEYTDVSTSYDQIYIYNILYSNSNQDVISKFYSNFINDRRIPIYFVIKYRINGMISTITQRIYYYYAVDTLGCTVDDNYFFLCGTLNDHELYMQYRYSSLNKLNCDTLGATKVKIDIYIYDKLTSYRGNQILPLDEFNNNIGATFNTNKELTLLRNNFNEYVTTATIVVSYLDDSDNIIWETIQVDRAYIGCISKATMHLYSNQTCISYQFDNNQICSSYYLGEQDFNSLGIFYQEKGVTHLLGYYLFHQAINYSISDQTMCFVCDDFVDSDTYAKKSCEENQFLTKQKLKTVTVGFGIISNYESILLKTVVSEYYGVFTPFIAVCGAVFIIVLIIVLSFLKFINN
ncbi:Conserved_hypothetical protein [Hexamita inflata]|uniref:Transmembrane protein n=1 Tax=Hexamita inflata TaxID=28002 RepID=A0AA86N9G9_9EUKA|nr:Conserved hypothetical protein [Hexamita inflata]